MEPFDLLVALWFTSAIVGGLALLGASATPRYRHTCLLVAAASFAVAGVLGILSIGVLFLVAAALCALGARRTRARAVVA